MTTNRDTTASGPVRFFVVVFPPGLTYDTPWETREMDDWKTRAARARDEVNSARHGEKDVALLRWAQGKDINTLRRAIFALNYLDALAETAPRLRKDLDDAPLSQIELLARWHGFDPKGAMTAAREAAKGAYSVATLSKALSNARSKAGVEADPRSYRENVGSQALSAIQRTLGGSISLDVTKGPDDPPVDFRYLRKAGNPPRFETIAGVIVGPYSERKVYHKRRLDWLYKAFGLAWFYHHVALLLPDEEQIGSYSDWARDATGRAKGLGKAQKRTPQRLPSVFIVRANPWLPSTFSDEEQEYLARIGR